MSRKERLPALALVGWAGELLWVGVSITTVSSMMGGDNPLHLTVVMALVVAIAVDEPETRRQSTGNRMV
jgi:hypothetical protein